MLRTNKSVKIFRHQETLDSWGWHSSWTKPMGQIAITLVHVYPSDSVGKRSFGALFTVSHSWWMETDVCDICFETHFTCVPWTVKISLFFPIEISRVLPAQNGLLFIKTFPESQLREMKRNTPKNVSRLIRVTVSKTIVSRLLLDTSHQLFSSLLNGFVKLYRAVVMIWVSGWSVRVSVSLLKFFSIFEAQSKSSTMIFDWVVYF